MFQCNCKLLKRKINTRIKPVHSEILKLFNKARKFSVACLFIENQPLQHIYTTYIALNVRYMTSLCSPTHYTCIATHSMTSPPHYIINMPSKYKNDVTICSGILITSVCIIVQTKPSHTITYLSFSPVWTTYINDYTSFNTVYVLWAQTQ